MFTFCIAALLFIIGCAVGATVESAYNKKIVAWRKARLDFLTSYLEIKLKAIQNPILEAFAHTKALWEEEIKEVEKEIAKLKNKLGILAMLLVVVALVAAPSYAQAATGVPVTFTATYDFSAAPPCAGTLVSDCVIGFRMGYKIGTLDVSLGTIPLPATLTGVVSLTQTYNAGPPYGNLAYYIVAQAKAQDGSVVESLPLNTTVLVRPAPFKTFTQAK
jgi:hypothetical protein